MKCYEIIKNGELIYCQETKNKRQCITCLSFKSIRPRFLQKNKCKILIGHWDGQTIFGEQNTFAFPSCSSLHRCVSIAVTHVVLFWVKSNLRLLRVWDIGGHQLFYFSYVFQSRSIWLGIAVTATVGQNARVVVFGHWSDVKLISRTRSRFHINCKTQINHKHYVKVNLTEKDIYSLFILFNSVDILRLLI